MNDAIQNVTGLTQHATGSITYNTPTAGVKASGTVTVVDYSKAVQAAATGTVTVLDYASAIAAQATGTVTVADYTKCIATSATATITVADYSSLSGVTVTVDGVDYVEGEHWTAETDNDTTATNLAAAIDGQDDLSAAAVAAVVTVTVDTAGTAGNAKALSQDGGVALTLSGANFSGGLDNLTVTVDGNALVQGTDWTAATDNDTTATSLASAIDALGSVGASAVAAAITVTAASAGAAGNSIALVTSEATGVTVSGATLSGGRDHLTVTIDGQALVQGTDWTAATDNDTTATSLASAIDGLANVGASATGAAITVTAAAAGSAGNSITQVTGDAAIVSVDAATLSGGQDHLVINVNGTDLTQGTDFNAVTDNDTTATNIAAAIDALANVGAAAVGAVVTITADAEGTAANAYALTTSDVASATVSGATLSGGVDGDTVTVGTDTFTCVTSSPGANEFSSIAELTALIDALANITATDDGSTISIVYPAPGAAGNVALTLGGSNAGDMAVSGATLTGGSDAEYTDAFETHEGGQSPNEVDVVINVTALTASDNVTVTPQVSMDKVTWIDRTGSGSLTATGASELHVAEPLQYMRFKIVLGGTETQASLQINAVPSVG